ncbi:MAG: DUF1549 and DUF1553 domain-containing protein [Pirellulaceae bacterium]|nr:DUF1549 and DUF1553 domain-containing protein [Pirellulaceae bacterium]
MNPCGTRCNLTLSLLVVLLLTTCLRAEIKIFPDNAIVLSGHDSVQRVLAEQIQDGQSVGDVTEQVVWKVSDLGIARIEGGQLFPVADGLTTLTATGELGKATVEVSVIGATQKTDWEFSRHLLPVLSRAGCNTGACHGALAGKGGFRLSLRGYHPDGDYHAITQAARGRRIELSDPGRSLLVAKPSGMIRHQGGMRLPPESRDYRVLVEWVTNGASGPSKNDSKLSTIHIQPELIRLQPGDRQRLIVTAEYEDGLREDVTDWAMFSSSDQTVARVDSEGIVEIIGNGDGAIVVWFSSQLALTRLSSPFPNQISDDRYAATPRRNFIDDLVLEKLKELNLLPSPRSTNSEFLRRVYLDTIGTLPTSDEVQLFLENERADKRDRVIDDLLARSEYVDYWSHRWSDLLLVNGRRLRPKAVRAYYAWIRDHVANNSPWDQMVREIVTAKGSSIENGATNFYALHQDPENMTENVSQAFLGLSIGCAKCHNHPLEKWTNDQYYAMANFFSRVKAKGWGGDARSGDGIRTLFAANQGELIQPLTGIAQRPTPLDGKPLPLAATGDRRDFLADWLTSSKNDYFRRAITNRVWAALLGKGLVEPVDDLRVSNPARNEPLLDQLSQFLVERDFDLKSLIREILISETYQRSSQPLPGNQDDRHYFSRYYPRRLSAEVLLDAISQVTEVPTKFTQIGYDGSDFQNTSDYPLGTRAIQLHDSAVVSEFLKSFGRNERDITCECERSDTPSLVQVLHISNGVTINERLREPNSCVQKSVANELDLAEFIHRAFVSTLSRPPTQQEVEGLSQMIQETPEDQRITAFEDLYWSIMSTREFLFNH